MPEVFVRCKFRIDTLRLKYDSDMTPQRGRFANHIQACYLRCAGCRHHERREDPKQSGLAAPVRTQKSKQFGGMNIKRNSVEGGTILVTMNQVAH